MTDWAKMLQGSGIPIDYVHGSTPGQDYKSPTDEISAITGKAVFGENNEIDPASAFTIFRAGWFDDPQKQIEIYSKARGIPVERYAVIDDAIVFQGDDGKLYRETPATLGQEVKRGAADLAAHSPELIGETIGAYYGGPVGAGLGAAGGEAIRQAVGASFGEDKDPRSVAGKIGLAGAAGLGGEQITKWGARGFNKLDAKVGGKIAEASGRDIGLITQNADEIAEWERRGRERGLGLSVVEAADSPDLLDTFNVLEGHPKTQRKMKQAKEQRTQEVDAAVKRYLDEIAPPTVTPYTAGKRNAEAADKSIKNLVRERGTTAKPVYDEAFKEQYTPDTQKMMAQLSRAKSQIEALKNVRPDLDVETMVRELNERKVPTIKQMREGDAQYANRIASDYKRIFKKDPPTIGGEIDADKLSQLEGEQFSIEQALSGDTPSGFDVPMKSQRVDTTNVRNQIMDLKSETVSDDPSWKALDKIDRMISEANGDLKKLHRVKISGIDNVLNTNDPYKGNKVLRREMASIKEKLLEAMEAVSPRYKDARNTFEEMSRPVDTALESNVGAAAKLKGDKKVRSVKVLLDTAFQTPESVAYAKGMIESVDPEAWQHAIRAHMEQVFDSVVKTGTPNLGGQFSKKFRGRQGEIMKAAMEPQQYETFSNFMELLERTKRIYGKESATATRQEKLKSMKGRLTPLYGKVAGNSFNPLKAPGRLGDFIESEAFERNLDKLADAMLSPEAAERLRVTVQIPPLGETWARAFGAFLAGAIKGYFNSNPGDAEQRIREMSEREMFASGLPEEVIAREMGRRNLIGAGRVGQQ